MNGPGLLIGLMVILAFLAIPLIAPKRDQMVKKMKAVRKSHHGIWMTYNELKLLVGFDGEDFYNLLQVNLLLGTIKTEKNTDEVSYFQNRYMLKPVRFWE